MTPRRSTVGRTTILMVTGAYYPEVSGASLQCRQLIRALRDRVSCAVLTTSSDASLRSEDEVDGVPVYRVRVDVTRPWSKVKATVRMAWILMRLRGQVDVVHLHGFSQKSLLVVAFARIFHKKVVLKLTSAGDDDPLAIRKRGRMAFRQYAKADLFIGVSQGLEMLYQAAGFPADKFLLIPNGVDVTRFRPRSREEQRALRAELGLPNSLFLILFVGFFSREKCPDVLVDAWVRLQETGVPATGLLLVGATRGPYHEIDPALAGSIREQASRRGFESRLIFVEHTQEIEKFYGAADLFALPSLREGLPNALLEAMASGLPCIASRLSGITDTIIEDGINGWLIPPGDRFALERGLRAIIEAPDRARDIGRRARTTIEERYAIAHVATRYAQAYRRLRETGARDHSLSSMPGYPCAES